MHITGTMTQMETYFEQWHTDDFATLHASLLTKIDKIESDKQSETNDLKNKLLTLANLISFKLDGDNTQINSIDNINNITSKDEAHAQSINLKDFNNRIEANYNEIIRIASLIESNASNNYNGILSRLTSLENSNLSTENIDDRINNYFEKNEILSGDDLNTYTKPGIYRCKLDSIASNVNHCATNTAFSLVVLRHSDNSVRQIINENDNNNNIWVRNYNNVQQSWSNWTKLYGEHNTFTFPMKVEFSNSTKTYTIIATDIQEE